MTEENKPAPPWRAALDKSILAALKAASYDEDLTDAVMAAVLPHMETSYKSGRMAGASKAGYRLVQKNLAAQRLLTAIQKSNRTAPTEAMVLAKELTKKLREIREAINYDEGATYSLDRIVDILGEDSP